MGHGLPVTRQNAFTNACDQQDKDALFTHIEPRRKDKLTERNNLNLEI